MSQNNQDQRRFPRVPHVISREIVRLDHVQTPRKNLILTTNLSASGIKFTTNETLNSGQDFLIDLDDKVARELNLDNKIWLRTGDSYLARVVWTQELAARPGFFEIGACFIEKTKCRGEELATFTELMNVSALERLAPQA